MGIKRLDLPWNHGLFNLTLLSTFKGENSALNPDFWIFLGKKMKAWLALKPSFTKGENWLGVSSLCSV